MTEQFVKNYALALFSLCCESDTLTDSYEQLKVINGVFDDNEEYAALASLPTITKEEKLKMICEAFEGKVSDVVLNFMCVLTENGRLINFSEIFLEFKKLYFEHIGIVEVEVITTAQLSERLVQKLKDKLSKQLNKQVILDTKIDEKLLGGIVIKYDNKQIDGSLRRKLADIKSSIDSVIA